MTLAMAMVGGLACGYFFGLRPIALAAFLAVFLTLLAAILLARTAVAARPEVVATGESLRFEAAIFALGIAMVWVGAKARASRAS